MKDKKLFTDRRWTQPLGGVITGNFEISEEERKENKRKFRERLIELGILKDDK